MPLLALQQGRFRLFAICDIDRNPDDPCYSTLFIKHRRQMCLVCNTFMDLFIYYRLSLKCAAVVADGDVLFVISAEDFLKCLTGNLIRLEAYLYKSQTFGQPESELPIRCPCGSRHLIHE